jgi:hypothetical protein
MINIFPIVPWVLFNANVALFEVGASNHNLYPIGHFNFLNLPKLPPWSYILKLDVPIMLCYNNTPKHGLCNGFQFIVTCLNDHVIEIHILTNTVVTEKTCVLRIILQPTALEIPFKFIPKTIPRKDAFAKKITRTICKICKFRPLNTHIFS